MFPKKNPFAWGRTLAMCACIGLALLSACSDDDSDAPDTDLPAVTVTGLTANAVVSKTVTISVKAEDNGTIQKVEVKVDGTVVLTKTDPSFNYDLNTTELTEGTHTLTVVVTDAAGNQKTEEFTFTVQNALITINVAAAHLRSGQKGYVYLSDADGEVFVSQELENGTTARLMAPSYTGADFMVTEVILEPSSQRWWFRTFPKVTRGTWVVSPRSVPFAPAAGEATLSFTNALPETEYIINSDWDAVALNEVTTKTINLYKNPSKLYITRKEEDVYPTHYLLTDPVPVNATTQIDLSKVSHELTRETFNIGGHGYTEGNSQIAGIVTPGDYFNSYLVQYVDWQENSMQIRYPGNAFPAYYTTSNFYGDNFVVANYVDGLPDAVPLECSIDVQVGEAITGTVTGDDADYAEVTILFETGSQWTIVAPKGTLNIPSPTPPEEILIQLTTGKSTIVAAAVQKLNFDGYDGLLEYIRSSDYGAAELYFFGSTFKRVDIDLAPSNARSGKHESLKRITQQLGQRPDAKRPK